MKEQQKYQSIDEIYNDFFKKLIGDTEVKYTEYLENGSYEDGKQITPDDGHEVSADAVCEMMESYLQDKFKEPYCDDDTGLIDCLVQACADYYEPFQLALQLRDDILFNQSDKKMLDALTFIEKLHTHKDIKQKINNQFWGLLECEYEEEIKDWLTDNNL